MLGLATLSQRRPVFCALLGATGIATRDPYDALVRVPGSVLSWVTAADILTVAIHNSRWRP